MRGPYRGKYYNLYIYLRTNEPESETMTFAQIEELLEARLPGSARDYPAWWANQERGQSLAWERAGYKTTSVNLPDERVTFLRGDQAESENSDEEKGETEKLMTIAEAKQSLAITFGVDPSQIEITIRA